jgi:triphosphoribosyl-dephospho-CoA synthase
MRAAANRDRIAFQYANGFRDVLELGVPRLRRCRAEGWTDAQAVSAVYLGFLACFPDSHVVRKHGSLLAEEVRRQAAAFEALLGHTDGHERCRPQLLAWDGELKARGLNPGTSADLTVASHFAAALFA